MSQPIIICEQLAKSYRLGVKQHKRNWASANLTLRETFSGSFRFARQILEGSRERSSQDNSLFWALRGVSFEIQRGNVFAIIGRNGAGKSTLLKILSRIVEPTEGTARLRGRVASLLEVGTGFHPELSGRENIYLNGSILGMRKTEINRKFDEIVAFSEIEEFLDTPVKRYSSGMYVRLAFAVAAHLEPEILIVDEVLAVGDFAFQKKCLGKMHDVATGEGRTILFVSHNLGALSQLCEQGILLEHGQVTTIGPVRDVIQTYLKSGLNHNTAQARFPLDWNKPCQYTSAEILRSDGTLGSDFGCDEPVIIRLQFEIRQPIPTVFLTFFLQNLDGTRVLFSDVRDTDLSVCERLGVGQHTFEIKVPARLLAPTTYLLTVGSVIRFTGTVDQRDTCCEFAIRDTSGSLSGLPYHASILGILLPWDHRRSGSAEASIPSNQGSSIRTGAQTPLPSNLG